MNGLPELPELGDIDFSDFHPLDHALLRCQGYPGGWRLHLACRWQFQWSVKVREWTACRVGRHRPGHWYRQGKTWVACMDCYRALPDDK